MERFGKKAETQLGNEQGGKAAAWHSPQRDAKSPSAYCAKTDSEVPASSDKGDIQCCRSGVTSLDKHAGELLEVVLNVGEHTQHAIH